LIKRMKEMDPMVVLRFAKNGKQRQGGFVGKFGVIPSFRGLSGFKGKREGERRLSDARMTTVTANRLKEDREKRSPRSKTIACGKQEGAHMTRDSEARGR